MKALFFLILTSLISICYAQQNFDEPIKQNIISINLGQSQFKDENLHPKVFRGLTFGATYSHTKIRKNISEYSTGLKMSLLNTAYEEFPSALGILVHGNYKYLFSVATNEKLIFYLGLINALQYGTNAYFNWDESHFYFANYISGGIGSRINYRIGKYILDFNLDIPIISGISRPKPNRQYKIDNMTFTGIMKNLSSNPELALPNKNFFLKTGFDFRFSTRLSVGYNFQYHFMRANNGEPYQNIEHAISYKFIF
ncbi:MAG: hypothetical protein EHM93_19200 [Bacteroidales bacterium]|nr:MAG: hypothetical protein EHM93_19200 [Bacteroidales bacterium]